VQDPPAPGAAQPDGAAQERGEVPQDPAVEDGVPAGSEAAGAAAVGSAVLDTADEVDWFAGSLSLRYIGRWTGDDSDHKVYATLSSQIGDPEQHDVTGYFMGRVVGNLERGGAVFGDIIDTWDSDVVAYVYDAYADVHSVSGLSRLRIGRQWLTDTPEQAFFDGAHVETEELGDTTIQLGVYGGSSTRLYESSQSGDWIVGGYAQATPWTRGRVRVDYMYMEDEERLGTNQNDLLGIGFWQGVTNEIQFELEHTLLEWRSRDVRSRVNFYDAEADLMVQVSYYQLLTTLKDLVNELDPFFNAMNELFPYYQFGAMLSKGFGEHVTVEGGGDVRRVDDEGDIGQFNRDYERFYANLRFHDVLFDGFSATLMSDLWYANGRDTRTFGFDLSQELSEPLTASVGSYYSLFKYDMFTNSERDDVRTYYVRLEHETTESLTLDIAYEFEDNDIDEFHTLRLRGVWRF
jgi:hypothetical protein